MTKIGAFFAGLGITVQFAAIEYLLKASDFQFYFMFLSGIAVTVICAIETKEK